MSYFLGIDMGTSSTKTLFTNEQGHTIALCSEAYGMQKAPNGGMEQHPDIWWQAVCKTTQGVLQQAGIPPEDISGIGLSGQMHGLVALDAANQPLRPAIIWMDARTKELIAQLPQEQIADSTLNRPATGFLAASLVWMHQNEPALFAQIKTVLLPKDYIRLKLTGMLGTDYSDASGTLAFDPVRHEWSAAVLHLLGLDASLFPSVHASYEIAGDITLQAAAQTGLYAGTRVVYGGGDSAMQNIGNGLVVPGLFCSNIGTAAQIATVCSLPVADAAHRVNTFCFADENTWSVAGASLSGGGVLNWLTKDILHTDDYTTLNQEAKNLDACPDGLLFLPYLTGERAPYHNSDARGVFFGLGRTHTNAHLFRAVMEGVTLALRCSLEIMQQLQLPANAVVASGGGTRSEVWLQIQADIYNREICVAETKEQACLGAAVVAAVGTGYYKNLQEACAQMVRLAPTRIQPQAGNVNRYEYYFSLFKDLYETNRSLFSRLAYMPNP